MSSSDPTSQSQRPSPDGVQAADRTPGSHYLPSSRSMPFAFDWAVVSCRTGPTCCTDERSVELARVARLGLRP